MTDVLLLTLTLLGIVAMLMIMQKTGELIANMLRLMCGAPRVDYRERSKRHE